MDSHHLWKSHTSSLGLISVSHFRIISFSYPDVENRQSEDTLSKPSKLGGCWKHSIEEGYCGLHSVASEQCGLWEALPSQGLSGSHLPQPQFEGVGLGENYGTF